MISFYNVLTALNKNNPKNVLDLIIYIFFLLCTQFRATKILSTLKEDFPENHIYS